MMSIITLVFASSLAIPASTSMCYYALNWTKSEDINKQVDLMLDALNGKVERHMDLPNIHGGLYVVGLKSFEWEITKGSVVKLNSLKRIRDAKYFQRNGIKMYMLRAKMNELEFVYNRNIRTFGHEWDSNNKAFGKVDDHSISIHLSSIKIKEACMYEVKHAYLEHLGNFTITGKVGVFTREFQRALLVKLNKMKDKIKDIANQKVIKVKGTVFRAPGMC